MRGECDANKVLSFWGPRLSLLVKWSALEICGSRKILCQGGTQILYVQKGFVYFNPIKYKEDPIELSVFATSKPVKE